MPDHEPLRPDSGVVVEEALPQVKQPPLYQVVLLNDDYTPMEFVVDVLEKCNAVLDQARPVRSIAFSKEELAVLKPLCLITAKPAMFVANVAEDGFQNNPHLDRLRAFAQKQHAPVVAICAKTEAELADMDDADKAMFLAEMGQTESGLARLIRADIAYFNAQPSGVLI